MSNDLKILTVIIAAPAIALVPVSAYERNTEVPLDLDIGVIIPDDDTIVGVHRGGACVFEDLSANQPEIDVLLNPELCMEDNHYYKSFSAWENVKDVLNLR